MSILRLTRITLAALVITFLAYSMILFFFTDWKDLTAGVGQ